MKSRLLWKLLGVNVLVLGVVILVVWLAFDYRAAAYFMALMKDYDIEPTSVHRMFLNATHETLIWTSLASLVLATVLSFLLTRRVLGPLSAMTEVSGKIAAGDYTARVDVVSRDEVGRLAQAFNRMADSLQRVEQLRKTMVIDVAHELRTPLTNMRGYLEALRDDMVPPSRDLFVSLHEETLRLAALVDDLLQLARAEASAGALQLRPVDLRELTEEVLDLYRPEFEAKGIAVERELAEAASPVPADPDRLAQVFRNLLQNAWQYTPPGGRVRISARALPGRVKLVFANSGEGIAAGDLPFIFERFYRGEKSRSRDHGGAGIGLAVVKGLVEAHRGEVGAESVPSETRIWITLPA